MLKVIASILNIIVGILPIVLSFLAGKKDEQAKQDEEMLDAIKDAKQATDKYDNDSDYAKRVREYFRKSR